MNALAQPPTEKSTQSVYCAKPLIELTASLSAWLLPNRCPLCDANIKDTKNTATYKLPICAECFAALPWCNETGPTLDERSAFYYLPPIREYILAGKGSNQLNKLHLLGQLLTIHFTRQLAVSKQAIPQAIIPVPLHRTRLRQRGFNQSIELIRPFARQHGIPLITQSVRRTRHTSEQKGLTESLRKINMQQAFNIDKALDYQHIAIFDDVITTGATCAEFRNLLLQQGVKNVEIWCCATTKNDLH